MGSHEEIKGEKGIPGLPGPRVGDHGCIENKMSRHIDDPHISTLVITQGVPGFPGRDGLTGVQVYFSLH